MSAHASLLHQAENDRYGLFINGRFADAGSGRYVDSLNPVNDQPWYQISDADTGDVDAAVSAARHALKHPSWSAITQTARGKMIRRLADLIGEHGPRLAEIETRDNGKLIREMQAQMTALQGQARGRFARDAYTFLHYPMVVGIVFFAVALEDVVAHPLDAFSLIGRLALAVGAALVLLSVVATTIRAGARVPLEKVAAAAVLRPLALPRPRRPRSRWRLPRPYAGLSLSISRPTARSRPKTKSIWSRAPTARSRSSEPRKAGWFRRASSSLE